jgi:hypothetical protein
MGPIGWFVLISLLRVYPSFFPATANFSTKYA